MFAFLDPPELILLVVVVLVLFGGSQLPKLAKNLGKAQKEFKDGLAEANKPTATTTTTVTSTPVVVDPEAAKAEELRKLEQRMAELKNESPPKSDSV
jgi:sec-independent protein translocase protein TatA